MARIEYQLVVDFFYKEGKMFFYAFHPATREVLCESDDFQTVFLKITIDGYDLQRVSFNKVSMLEEVAKILKANGIEILSLSQE